MIGLPLRQIFKGPFLSKVNVSRLYVYTYPLDKPQCRIDDNVLSYFYFHLCLIFFPLQLQFVLRRLPVYPIELLFPRRLVSESSGNMVALNPLSTVGPLFFCN